MSAARQITTGRPSETECQAVHAMIDCVAPLVRDLRERGLVASYFFTNRWADSHIRLRLRPTSMDHLDEIGRTVEAAMTRFLARHEPRPDEPEDCLRVDHLVLLYADEEQRWISADVSGRVPGRVRYQRYEPDYGRYGGPAGVELAEWHSEHSSDHVLELAQSVDTHTRQVMLGLSAQLTMTMTAAFVSDTGRLAAYLASLGPAAPGEVPDEAGRVLRARFAQIRTAAADPSGGDDPGDGYRPGDPVGWASHCRELHARVLELHRAGSLTFPGAVPGDEVALRLLTSYLRATNNRLGASPADEAYVAQLLARALG